MPLQMLEERFARGEIDKEDVRAAQAGALRLRHGGLRGGQDMEALLYFAFWAGLIFFMIRFGCGAHVMGHGEGQERQASGDHRREAKSGDLRWEPPAEVKDPICGKTIRTANAKSSVFNGFVYYFCSSECREQFETHMAALGQTSTADESQKLEHSHA